MAMLNSYCCCLSPEQKEARLIDRKISRQLTKDKRKDKRIIKLLLLGTGESGKSTFIKQMRIINGKGYSEDDLKGYTTLVYQNVFMAIQALISGMELLNLEYGEPSSQAFAAKLKGIDHMKVDALDEEQAGIINHVWKDAGVQDCFSQRNRFQISDSAEYFLESVDRIVSAEFVPTQEDVLRVRAPTTGIQEYSFKLPEMAKDGVSFLLVDVGGQRSERRKWIHCFENVTSVLFLVALSEYDQLLLESDENRLEESKALFQTILDYDYFHYPTSFILFLNKEDLLEEKVKRSHLVDYFPAFEGPTNNAVAAKHFIMKMFDDVNGGRASMYPHFTCATDTSNIRKVFVSVKDTIIQTILKEWDLKLL